MIWNLHAYLMVDPCIVAEESNTSLVREEALRDGDGPIVGPADRRLMLGSRPQGIGSGLVPEMVIRDGATYRLWYQARGMTGFKAPETVCQQAPIGYAESRDGVHFEPAHVGRIVWRGSRKNNLVDFGLPAANVRISGLLHDPLDREFPFKCVYNRPAKGTELEPGLLARWPHLARRDWFFVWGIGHSRDGLAWEPPGHAHNLIRANPEHAKLHRAMDGGLVISDQMVTPAADWSYRNVKGWITYDLETAHRIPDYLFAVPQHMVRVDVHNYGGLCWHGLPWVQPHVGLVCARKGPTILALNGYLCGATGAETFAQTAEVGLCASETGIQFREIWPFCPFIRRGHRGSWDSGMAAQCAIVDNRTETRFYYAGGDGNFAPHYWGGLARVPRDRYGYRLIRGMRQVDERDAEGWLRLKPCVLPAEPRIALNVSQVSARQIVQVELGDAQGRPLRGYALRDSEPVTRAGLRQPVRWKRDRTAAELAGRTVCIRLRLHNPACRIVRDDSPRVYAVYTGQE
jgi:hypothetical protein